MEIKTEAVSSAAMEREVFDLLRRWGDALVSLQIRSADPKTDGGILCPACGRIHGRCHEAAYPLLCIAARTGDAAYTAAAQRLFLWGENMVCPDGGVKNDFDSPWEGVTVFAALSLHDALFYHGALPADETRKMWEARLLSMGEWIRTHIFVGARAYINYYAAGAAALSLLGNYFSRDDFCAAAKTLAEHCFSHVSENGLLYGESSPHDARSPKGCRGIDHGYNAEESLPALCRYAASAGDAAAKARCVSLWRAQLPWMLPDGAWDNGAGTRSFKWTYWGSRTADGSFDALLGLGKTDPVFAQAALRNLRLLRRNTADGLLAGGPDYKEAGEGVCVHHTFCHMKSLAAALDAGIPCIPAAALPSETPPPLRYYPETDTWRLALGGWLADVTGYDVRYKRGGHVSGGALSLLWSGKTGAIAAAGMAAYSLFEPNNQQLPAHPEQHRCPCPRIETADGAYAQHFDFAAVLRGETTGGAVSVSVNASLCDIDGERMPGESGCALRYTLRADGLLIEGGVSPAAAGNTRFVLPVSPAARVECLRGTPKAAPDRIFCLTPGFLLTEHVLFPDENGRFAALIGAE